jgi:hypothetical protein
VERERIIKPAKCHLSWAIVSFSRPAFGLASSGRIGDLNEDDYRSMSKIGAVDVIGL